VKSIRLRELWDVHYVPAELLAVVGYGGPVEEAEKSPVSVAIATNFVQAIGYTAAEHLGVTFDRVEETHDYDPAVEDTRLEHVTVPQGSLGRVVHRFSGWVDDIGPDPFFTMEAHWVAGPTMLPEDVKPHEYWVAEVEGTPSFRMSIDLRTSLADDAPRVYDYGNLHSGPGYHGTIAPCLQAIPHLLAAGPGVLPSFGPGITWRRDLRTTEV
jgi:2,4-diaminopentanoate dehydrogenase